MLKVLGGLLILAGGGIICTRRIRASRRELAAVREWIAALEQMAGETLCTASYLAHYYDRS